jgi:CDGSH-type Zn-finger protein
VGPLAVAGPGTGRLMGAHITPYRNGPYLVRGDFALTDQDGEEINLTRRTIALCRCGKSRTRPFCDGTHKVIGFQAAGTVEGEPKTVASSSATEWAERESLESP